MSRIWQDADNWMFDLELKAEHGSVTNRERKIYQKLVVIKNKYHNRYLQSKSYRNCINKGYCAQPLDGSHRHHPFYKEKYIRSLSDE